MSDSVAARSPVVPMPGTASSGPALTVSTGGAAGANGLGGSASPGVGAPDLASNATSAAGAGIAGLAQQIAESAALTEQGRNFSRTARWRLAIEPLRRATELDPTNTTAFYYLGDAYNHADALAPALEAFEAASKLDPDHWRALKGIGVVLDRMRRPQEAAPAYQRAREAQNRATPRLP